MSESSSAITSIADDGEFRFARFYNVYEGVPLVLPESPPIVSGVSDMHPSVSKRGRDTEFDAKIRQEEMRAFFSTNVPSTFPSEIDRMIFLLILLITSNGTVRFMRQSRFYRCS